LHTAGFEAEPGEIVGGEFLAEGDDAVAGAPSDAVGDGGNPLRGVLDDGDLVAVGANQLRRVKPTVFIGLQLFGVVQGAEVAGIGGQINDG